MLTDLDSASKRDPDRARALLQDLLGEIRFVEEGEEVWAEIRNRADHLLLAAGAASINVVAGAGFEPATFGL
jgi:hypothetical protein